MSEPSPPAATSIRINGQTYPVGDPDMPLLWLLRDVIGLTGTKYGCGAGQCGACTVHMDGIPLRACTIRSDDATGEITTIEGASGPIVAALEAAWISHQVAQCGYCQPGQIMAALALLQGNARPDDAAIDAGMAGNLCRCATYFRIRRAIHAAADALA